MVGLKWLCDCFEKYSIWRQSCNRLLIIKIAADSLKIVLLSCEQESFGVEECDSLQWLPAKMTASKIAGEEQYWQWLTEQLLRLQREWQLEGEALKLAILMDDVYEEEFSLPLLSSKQLQQVVKQECEMRIPLEQGNYDYSFLILPKDNEHQIRVAAIDAEWKNKLLLLQQNLGYQQGFLGGSTFLGEQEEQTPIEFWNCFNNKDKERQLGEMYGELIKFGRACLQKGKIVNLFNAQGKNASKVFGPKIIAGLGLAFLGICILSVLGLSWKNYDQQQRKQELAQEMKRNEVWTLRQQQWQKLHLEIHQREQILQQLKHKAVAYEPWLEYLGKLMPANCWLTSLETDVEGNLLLRGKSKEIGSIELFRKQLLAGELCGSCDLLETKSGKAGESLSFTMKIKRK